MDNRFLEYLYVTGQLEDKEEKLNDLLNEFFKEYPDATIDDRFYLLSDEDKIEFLQNILSENKKSYFR